MEKARMTAKETFKYFWRELSWERRRIIPGLGMAAVKLPFTDGPRTDDNPEVEQMWVGEVEYDGQTLSGILMNSPIGLASVKEGDRVEAPFSDLSDWMFTSGKFAYGGFTVHLMRSGMDVHERRAHDKAWGLDFGDSSDIRVEFRESPSKPGLLAGLFGRRPRLDAQPVSPDGFRDHPMCVNCLEKMEKQIKGDPSVVQSVDKNGWPILHQEAMAGNLGLVKLLVKYGADVDARTPDGRTASELARGIGWPEVAKFLDSQTA